MLVCLVCPKQAHLPPTPNDDHHHATLGASNKPAASPIPSKEHVKSFTTQLKDIVMKFSTGAYRHCRPCTAAASRGDVADDDQTLYEDDDEKSSILVASNSEDQACMSDHVNLDDEKLLYGATGNVSPRSTRYDFLPMAQGKRHHRHKKTATSSSCTSSSSTLKLKQLPSHPESMDAIEQLLNAHFRREEELLAEEQSQICREDEQLLDVESRTDHRLLNEVQLVCKEHHDSDTADELAMGDSDHVKRRKKSINLEPGKFEEWVAQVEPGVMITLVALPDGSNHLKRIRFSRDLYSKWQAQLWWAENSDMVRELYSVSMKGDTVCDHVHEENAAQSSSSSSSSSSSCTTTSSSHQNVQLRNTPEIQSRVGSNQSSPSHTSCIITTMVHSSPHACNAPLPTSVEIGSHEMMNHHDNPLYDRPEFELCYHESAQSPLILHRELWIEGQPQDLLQHDGEEGNDFNALAQGIVRELKRVRFIKQQSPPTK